MNGEKVYGVLIYYDKTFFSRMKPVSFDVIYLAEEKFTCALRGLKLVFCVHEPSAVKRFEIMHDSCLNYSCMQVSTRLLYAFCTQIINEQMLGL